MANENKWIKIESTNVDSTLWEIEKGAELEGIYKSKRENVGPNKSNMYYVETKDGLYSFWGTTLLDDRFSSIEIGEEVKLKCLGKTTSPKSGRSYYDFELWHRQP